MLSYVGNTQHGEELYGNTYFVHENIMLAHTLDPFTHVYMYDWFFTIEVMLHVATLLAASEHTLYIVSYRTKKELDQFGFSVEFLTQVTVASAGEYQL